MVRELRHYIRHPSAIPLHFSVQGCQQKKPLKDIGKGGLSFVSERRLSIGECIHIKIDSCKPKFEAEGIVRWCRPIGKDFLIGVSFQDKKAHFAIRMIEQICHIEAYKQKVKAETGVMLSSDQAAREWIEKYAGDFPVLKG